MRKKKRITDAVELMDRWYGGSPEWDRLVFEEEVKARVAMSVYALRTEAKLTQTRLAKVVGTTQSVISKVENADYDGSALEMLLRVCLALHRRIEIDCPPAAPDREAVCRIAVAGQS